MAGKRIDAYLASRYPDFSRSVIQKVIDARAVLINGQPTKASYKVREGDAIRVWLPELGDGRRGRGHPARDRLRGRQLHRGQQAAGPGHAPRQGELDRDAGQRPPVPLRRALDRRRREPAGDRPPARPRHLGPPDRRQGRQGPPRAGPPVRGPDDPARNTSPSSTAPRRATATTSRSRSGSTPRSARRWPIRDVEDGGKEASTFYEVLERFRGYALVRCQPEDRPDPPDPRPPRPHRPPDPRRQGVLRRGPTFTLGDLLGPDHPDAATVLIARQALHAHALDLNHPITGEPIRFHSPPPADFAATLAALRAHRS